MSGVTDIPGVTLFGKGTKDFVLPVGYVDGAGKLHDTIVLREMTGAEDDMMGNEELPIGDRATEVLAACTVKLGDVTDKNIIRKAIADELDLGLPLTEQDRLAALVFLRRTSLGDLYKFERRCPRCGTNASNRTTDLRSLRIDKCKNPDRRRVALKLPNSGKEVVIRVLTAKSATAIGRLRPSQKDLKSLAIAARIESLDGVKFNDPNAALSQMKSLPVADRNRIRQTYMAMEAFVETDIEVECRNPVCLTTWSFSLDVGQSFFLDLDGKVEESDLKWL